MKENTSDSPIYSHDALELVTVAVQYCSYVETAHERKREDFADTILKMLPLLYLKGALCPKLDTLDDYSAPFALVTQENYDIVRNNVALVMGDMDDYLDVFVEDMKYSDTPLLTTISENLADIYQDLKNFVLAYRDGTDPERLKALSECKANFETYWGQRLTNVMRALHEVRYNVTETE